MSRLPKGSITYGPARQPVKVRITTRHPWEPQFLIGDGKRTYKVTSQEAHMRLNEIIYKYNRREQKEIAKIVRRIKRQHAYYKLARFGILLLVLRRLFR